MVLADSRRVTILEKQEKVAGQVEGLAVAGDQSFLISWALFFKNVLLAALVQEGREQAARFTRRWDMCRSLE